MGEAVLQFDEISIGQLPEKVQENVLNAKRIIDYQLGRAKSGLTIFFYKGEEGSCNCDIFDNEGLGRICSIGTFAYDGLNFLIHDYPEIQFVPINEVLERIAESGVYQSVSYYAYEGNFIYFIFLNESSGGGSGEMRLSISEFRKIRKKYEGDPYNLIFREWKRNWDECEEQVVDDTHVSNIIVPEEFKKPRSVLTKLDLESLRERNVPQDEIKLIRERLDELVHLFKEAGIIPDFQTPNSFVSAFRRDLRGLLELPSKRRSKKK